MKDLLKLIYAWLVANSPVRRSTLERAQAEIERLKQELERLGKVHGEQLMRTYREHEAHLQKLQARLNAANQAHQTAVEEHEAERRAHEETKQKHHNLQLEAVVHFRYMKKGIPAAFRNHIPRDIASEHNAHWQGEPMPPAKNSIARPAHDWP